MYTLSNMKNDSASKRFDKLIWSIWSIIRIHKSNRSDSIALSLQKLFDPFIDLIQWVRLFLNSEKNCALITRPLSGNFPICYFLFSIILYGCFFSLIKNSDILKVLISFNLIEHTLLKINVQKCYCILKWID